MLTSPDGWRILSSVLISEKKGLHESMNATEIAEAIRKLTVGPPGLVATRRIGPAQVATAIRLDYEKSLWE